MMDNMTSVLFIAKVELIIIYIEREREINQRRIIRNIKMGLLFLLSLVAEN